MDSAVPSFLASRNGFPGGSQFGVQSGNYLLTISMITQAGSFGDGPVGEAPPRHSAHVEALIRSQD